MAERPFKMFKLSTTDLEFVVGSAAPEANNREHLQQLVQEDEAFRNAFVGDEKIFKQVISDQDIFLKVSPALYFEVLLRRALREFEGATHTVERTGKQNIPVFDVQDVVDILGRVEMLDYLAQMLASFTRINSYTVPIRVRKGIRRRIRYNDMEIDSLIRFGAVVDEEHRFGFYKRIGDVCLFVAGIFQDYVFYDYRYPVSSDARPPVMGRLRRSLEEYEETGRQFYGLAQKHSTAQVLGLSEVFAVLGERFTTARKPLDFISTQYLHSLRRQVFYTPTS